jgi:hypothetical protein
MQRPLGANTGVKRAGLFMAILYSFELSEARATE